MSGVCEVHQTVPVANMGQREMQPIPIEAGVSRTDESTPDTSEDKVYYNVLYICHLQILCKISSGTSHDIKWGTV